MRRGWNGEGGRVQGRATEDRSPFHFILAAAFVYEEEEEEEDEDDHDDEEKSS